MTPTTCPLTPTPQHPADCARCEVGRGVCAGSPTGLDALTPEPEPTPEPNRAHLLALLRRALIALMYPARGPDAATLADDISAVLPVIPKSARTYCGCGEPATDGKHCNERSQFQVGDG